LTHYGFLWLKHDPKGSKETGRLAYHKTTNPASLIDVLVMLGILMVINPLVMEYDVLVGGFKHDFYFS